MPGLLSLLGITKQSLVSTVGFKVQNVPHSARNQSFSSLGAVEKGKWLLCPSKAGCIDFEEAVIYLNFAEAPPLFEVLWKKTHSDGFQCPFHEKRAACARSQVRGREAELLEKG